jgi:hypothetical protein
MSPCHFLNRDEEGISFFFLLYFSCYFSAAVPDFGHFTGKERFGDVCCNSVFGNLAITGRLASGERGAIRSLACYGRERGLKVPWRFGGTQLYDIPNTACDIPPEPTRAELILFRNNSQCHTRTL